MIPLSVVSTCTTVEAYLLNSLINRSVRGTMTGWIECFCPCITCLIMFFSFFKLLHTRKCWRVYRTFIYTGSLVANAFDNGKESRQRHTQDNYTIAPNKLGFNICSMCINISRTYFSIAGNLVHPPFLTDILRTRLTLSTFKLPNPPHDTPELHKICQSPVLEAEKLSKGRSGTSSLEKTGQLIVMQIKSL